VKSKLAADPARAHNTTAARPNLNPQQSAMAPAICSEESWLAVRLKVALVWRLLHRSLNSLRACHHTWVNRVRQVSIPRPGRHSISVDTSPARQSMVSTTPTRHCDGRLQCLRAGQHGRWSGSSYVRHSANTSQAMASLRNRPLRLAESDQVPVVLQEVPRLLSRTTLRHTLDRLRFRGQPRLLIINRMP
jgi:hypothetical protein